MARTAWLATLATMLALLQCPSWAGPLTSEAEAPLSIWEEHGAGRKDGLTVGAYPLPPAPAANRSAALRGEEADSAATERWLQRHYQWLRALRAVAGQSGPHQESPGQPRGAAAAFASPTPPGAMRLGDVVVLYAQPSSEAATPHLLDDGARNEDPELRFRGAEAFDLISIEPIVEEVLEAARTYVAPLVRDARSAILSAASSGQPRGWTSPAQGPHAGGLSTPGVPSASAAPRMPGATATEPYTLLGFFKKLALDALTSPTTYLLTVVALLVWLLLRVTVLSRS